MLLLARNLGASFTLLLLYLQCSLDRRLNGPQSRYERSPCQELNPNPGRPDRDLFTVEDGLAQFSEKLGRKVIEEGK